MTQLEVSGQIHGRTDRKRPTRAIGARVAGAAVVGAVACAVATARAASLTEIYLPQYAISGATTGSRLQSAAYLRIDGLTPNTSYRYFCGADITNGDTTTVTLGNFFGITPGGTDGLIDGYTSAKSLGGSVLQNNEFTTGSRYAVLTTNTAGSYTGWFSVVPIGGGTFQPGNNIYFYVQLNNGNSGNSISTSLASADTLAVLGTGSTAPGSSLAGDASAAIGSEKMVLLYNNVAGTGRPLWVTWTENDGITTNFTSWYESNVGSTANRWGAYIPSNLAGGVERIEYRDASGALLGVATSADGTWGTVNTAALSNGSGTPSLISAGPAGRSITWNNAAATSVWNTTDTNFTDGTSNVAFSSTNADSAVFGDMSVGTVTIAGMVTPLSVTFNHNAGTFTLSGGSIGGSAAVLKTNGGTLILGASNTYTGGTNVTGGTLVAAAQGALPDGGALSQSNGAIVQITARAASGGVRKTLNISAYTTDTSNTVLDLNDDDLIITSGSATVVRGLIVNGLGNLAGPQILSTWAGSQSGQGLGYLSTDDYRTARGNSFDGYTLANGGVIVKYTYLGDADLDGVVDISDYALIDAGFLLGKPASWLSGDFNYDGVIDYRDYALIDAAYLLSGPGLAGSAAEEMIEAHEAEFGAPYVDALAAAVPEPGLIVLWLIAIPMLRRGRRLS